MAKDKLLRVVHSLLLVLPLSACSGEDLPRVLHEQPSPDGRWRCRVVLERKGNLDNPRVSVILESSAGERMCSDLLKAPNGVSQVKGSDVVARWISSTRAEVVGWGSQRTTCIWQLEESRWMDRGPKYWDEQKR